MSNKRYDYINVVDLELTCWETPEEQGDQKQEIIQIGVAQLCVKTLTVGAVASILVRPTRSKISSYCTNLTGLTWDRLRREGLPFDGACNRLVKMFGTRSRLWASFGVGDQEVMQEQCPSYGANYPFGERYLDISELIRGSLALESNPSLQQSLELYGLQFVGRPHNGLDDAINTAELLAAIYKKLRPVQ